MNKHITLETFQGPLDLLLQLIEQEKLSITEIAVSQVTEQYFEYLKKLEESRPEELADFLVIATKLVYLKSRQLLPYLYPEEDEGPSLAEQLKLYKRYADASKEIERLWNRGCVGYGRIESPLPLKKFVAPVNARAVDLRAALINLLNRLKPLATLPQVAINHSVTIRQKLENLQAALQKLKKLSFSDLVRSAQSKTEVIISFLAVLELVKQQQAAIQQGKTFGEMVIKRV